MEASIRKTTIEDQTQYVVSLNVGTSALSEITYSTLAQAQAAITNYFDPV